MIRSILLGMAIASPGLAQSTAGDILSALEAPTSELERLVDVLEGPDEAKTLTAMRLMLASGDPAMQRLALRAGLTSTSAVARGVAFESYLSTQPTLTAFATVEDTRKEGFANWIQRIGSIASATTGTFPIVIGPYNVDQNCFASTSRVNECLARAGGTELSFLVGAAWGTARLNDSGELTGSISNASYETGPIALTIPLLGQLQ